MKDLFKCNICLDKQENTFKCIALLTLQLIYVIIEIIILLMKAEKFMTKYEEPVIFDGAVIEIYACKGNTCNGKTHAICLEDEKENSKGEVSIKVA